MKISITFEADSHPDLKQQVWDFYLGLCGSENEKKEIDITPNFWTMVSSSAKYNTSHVRLYNCLKEYFRYLDPKPKESVDDLTVFDVSRFPERDLMKVRNFGRGSLGIIVRILKEYNLQLSSERVSKVFR